MLTITVADAPRPLDLDAIQNRRIRRALEDDPARGYYIIGNGSNPAVAELMKAAVAVGAPAAVPASDDEAGALGRLLRRGPTARSGQPTGPTARAGLGWHSSHPLLVDEFRHRSYLT